MSGDNDERDEQSQQAENQDPDNPEYRRMTVGDLKALLADPSISDDMLVCWAQDNEGNAFAPISFDDGISVGRYVLDDDDFATQPVGEQYGEEDHQMWDFYMEVGVPAICVWPGH